MRILLVLIFILMVNFAVASTMDVKTGYGYIRDNEGKVVCRYDLPVGQHPLIDGYTYVEVPTKEDMIKVEIYKEPVKILTSEEKIKKIGLTKEELKELVK